jgi:tRNA(fMet)-specific endonuclease VapC
MPDERPPMGYLFDTDAISELFKRRPSERYVRWLTGVPREDQFTSAIVMGELYAGAYRSQARARHLKNIRDRVVPLLTILPFETDAAERYGRIRAQLEDTGRRLADADLQIAATTIAHRLTLVTGNVRHFERIAGLALDRVLADART